MLAACETALLARLRGHRDVARLVRTVGALPAAGVAELLQRYVAEAPALYLVPGTFRADGDNLFVRVTVIGVARNAGGPNQARLGDGQAIGCDHLMLLACRAIHGQRLGPATWMLQSGQMADDELFDEQGLAAVELVFESTAIEIEADWVIGDLADFEHFHGDIDIPPFESGATHNQWAGDPPDYTAAAPDAQLDVQLPGDPDA